MAKPTKRSCLKCINTLIGVTPSLSLSGSQESLSNGEAPHFHQIIITSFLCSLCLSSTFVGQVSLPYNMTVCMHALYSSPFSLDGTALDVRSGRRFLNLPKAHCNLVIELGTDHHHQHLTCRPGSRISGRPLCLKF